MDPERCDPALLSCITMEEIQFVLPFIFLIGGAFVIWRFVRRKLNEVAAPPPRRGTAPGEGQTVTTINMHSQGRGRDHIVTVRHTKDPQKHAQAMMPANARKKDTSK